MLDSTQITGEATNRTHTPSTVQKKFQTLFHFCFCLKVDSLIKSLKIKASHGGRENLKARR